MVKLKLGQQFFPARGSVTVFATLLERAFVGIDVARRASIEPHVLVARRPARHVGLVTLLASYLNVEPGQWIARL